MGFSVDIRVPPPDDELAQAIADRNTARAERDAATALLEDLRPIATRAVRAELVLKKWFEAGRQEHIGDTDALVDVFNKVVDILHHKEPADG